MRIGDVKVGEEYRLGYNVWTKRGKVIEIKTEPVEKGYGWNRKTIQQKRAIVQVLGTDSGQPIEGGKTVSLTGRDIEEPWSAFEERHGEFLAKQRAENEVQAKVERALERVDVDANVRISHRYKANPIEVIVSFKGDEAREWFLKVLQAAEPFVSELREEEE